MDAAFCAATVGDAVRGARARGVARTRRTPVPERPVRARPGSATHTWGCMVDGSFDGWAMLDGCLPAPSAGHDRDGNDLFSFLVGRQGVVEFIDIEILESWYPLLVREKRPRPGDFGAGTFRSGAGCQMSYRPYGTDALHGVMLAMRERLPLLGMAGGLPGATTRFLIHRPDGSVEAVDGHAMNVIVSDGESSSSSARRQPPPGRPTAPRSRVRRARRAAWDDAVAEADEIYGVALNATTAQAEDTGATGTATRSAWST